MISEKKKGSSIERVLQIIEIVAASHRPISVNELSETLDVPIPSMYRLLSQIQNMGFLQIDTPGKVICGQRTYKLAMHVWQNSQYKIERTAILQKLSYEIGETVGIAVVQDLEVIYIDRVLSNWPLQIHLPPGIHVPIWASASGKLLLSQFSEEKCRKIINKLDVYALTTNTKTSKKQLLQVISEARKTKIGTDNEEFIPGMVACAVPINNGDYPPFATVFTHSPTVRKSLEDLLESVPLMREAANELSLMLK